MPQTLTLPVVGLVHSTITDVDEERDWHDVESEIHIDPALAPGLKGIEVYTDIVVVFYLHKYQFNPERDLQQSAPGRPGGAPVGIFALRTHQRPNAIGATTVRLLEVRGNILRVKGLDAFDGSPVLDVKPNLPPVSRKSIEVPKVEPEI